MREMPLGLCQCGCGETTTIPTSTNRKLGRFKGVPMRYVSGHNGRGAVIRQGPDWIAEDRGYLTPCLIWQHHLSRGGYGKATDAPVARLPDCAGSTRWKGSHLGSRRAPMITIPSIGQGQQ